MAEVKETKTAQTAKSVEAKPNVLKPAPLKPIAEGESGKFSYKMLSENMTEVEYVVTLIDKKRYQVTSRMDFSGLSQSDILDLASRSVLAKLRGERRILVLNEATDPTMHAKVNVKLAIENVGKATSLQDAAAKALAKSAGISYEAALIIVANAKQG